MKHYSVAVGWSEKLFNFESVNILLNSTNDEDVLATDLREVLQFAGVDDVEAVELRVLVQDFG